jgi:hypothetical protein
MFISTDRVEKVQELRRRNHLDDAARVEHELLSLLEQPMLSKERKARLAFLISCFPADRLAEVLSRPSVHEVGAVTLPRQCRLCNSRLDVVDSEDPASFVPVKSLGDAEPEIERSLVRNASGHGPRFRGAYHG